MIIVEPLVADTANTDQSFYDEEPVGPEVIRAHATAMRELTGLWLPRLERHAAGSRLQALELGSGTCVLAALVAQQDCVASVTCTDISRRRMEESLRSTLEIIPTDPAKFDYAELDFNKPFPIEDSSLDLVVCDAALHHARSMWFTLAEVNRVLKPGGLFVAQRERFLAPLTGHIVTRRMLTDPEFEAGVSENSYTVGQYRYYLSIAGFEMQAMRAEQGTKFKMLALLNGILFSKYVLWATKVSTPRYSV